MKRFLIIMLAGIFFCNIVMAKEINTKFGFSIDLPDNYFAVQNENMDDVMKRLETVQEGHSINKDLINNFLSEAKNQGVNIEYYLPVDHNPEFNNLNIVVQEGKSMEDVKRTGLPVLCPYFTKLFTNMFGREVKRHSCKFLKAFAPKYETVLSIKHDSALSGNMLVQYTFKTNAGLSVITINCQKKNCNTIEKQTIGMMLSIKQL